jgi:hypothetical protein
MAFKFPFGEVGHQPVPQLTNESDQKNSLLLRGLFGAAHFCITGSTVVSFAILLM